MEEVVYTKGTPEFREVLDKRRRISDEPRKSFEATQLWDRYQEIARRIVLGQKNVDIANDLGVTPTMVSLVKNSPLVKDHIASLQEKADEEAINISARIKELAPKALQVLEDIVVRGQLSGEAVPARIRGQHAENLLDRAGHAAPKEVRSLNLHGHYTSEDIEKIKQRALSRASGQTIVVDS